MLFTEFRYFLFFAVAFSIYWLLRRNTHRKIFLLGASYYFYGSWDWRFLSLIILSTLLDYVLGARLASAASDRQRRALIVISVVTNLGILGVFKYFNFFADSFADLAGLFGVHVGRVVLHVILPVGVSFYTFQSLSYTIDLYRKQIRPADSLLDFAVAVAFFPHLVAGPIMRARDYLSQLDSPRRFANVDVRWALILFLGGFFKKACVSDNVSPFVDRYFADPSGYGVLDTWLAIVMYALQIYCDFSGYTDMGIASAGLLGYRLAENFNAPYLASDIADFWRRWHISLSSWLRDYLYIPLGGNRAGTWMANRNLMITMLLGGLWHGASWNFLLWGFMHGLALVVHRLWRARRSASSQPASPQSWQFSVGWLLTLTWVCLAWIPFRAKDFPSTAHVFMSTIGLGGPAHRPLVTAGGAWILWLAIGSLFAIHVVTYRGAIAEWWRRLPAQAFAPMYGALWSLAVSCKPVGHVPFIYFQF